ncbi:MAG: nickel/cobalt transporter [Desulfitobacteriaceae bacterium]
MELIYTVPAVLGLGALHSLEPGHGKGVITAYLISSGAKIKDGVLIGIISALAHTLSISLLALSASSTVKILLPQSLVYWFQLFSGIIVIYIGLRIISNQMYPSTMVISKVGHSHTHHCNHDHKKSPINSTSSPLKNLFMMGFFTGLVPCPSALAILLAAVSADKIPLGLGLIAAFSIGSAITMVTIGLLVIRAGNSIKKFEKWNVMNRLTLVSSFIILFLGGTIILQSASHIGVSATF